MKYECVLFTSLITIYKTSQSGTVGSRESAVLDIPPTSFDACVNVFLVDPYADPKQHIAQVRSDN